MPIGGHEKYGGQLILQFNPDATISNGTEGMAKKAKAKGLTCAVVTVAGRDGTITELEKKKVKFALSMLFPPIRLYIRGHGGWKSQKIGGWSAAQVAELLKKSDLPQVLTVSVTGCQLGRDMASDSDAHRVQHSIDSFGSQLHQLIKDECGIKTNLHARIYKVGTYGPKEGSEAKMGRKGAFGPSGFKLKQPQSKLVFYWDGETQRRKWADTGIDVNIWDEMVDWVESLGD